MAGIPLYIHSVPATLVLYILKKKRKEKKEEGEGESEKRREKCSLTFPFCLLAS